MGEVIQFPEVAQNVKEEEVKEVQQELTEEQKSDELLQVYANLIWGRAQTSIVPLLIQNMSKTQTIEEFAPIVESIVNKEAVALVQSLEYDFCTNIFTEIATREGLGFLAKNPARYLKKAMIKEFILNFLEIMTSIQMTVASNTLFSTMYQASMKAAQAANAEEEVGEAPAETPEIGACNPVDKE